jgi:hypothetical protein
MRRIELGYGLSITGELAGTVALVSTRSAQAVPHWLLICRLQDRGWHGVVLVLTDLTNWLRRDPAWCAGSPGFARSSWRPRHC